MNDHLDSLAEPSDEEYAALAALLARAEPWDEPPRELEDAVVAAITAEADTDTTAGNTPPTSLTEHRARRSWSTTRVLGAVAAITVVVAGVAVLTRQGDSDAVSFELAGTEAQPDASADVEVSATPAGLKILLDADRLPGAPDGFMYEAWVGDGTIGVSAGTFHLRGGDGPIELWAGVTDPSFEQLWVTLEPIDDDPTSSGDVRLWGDFSFPQG